MSAGQPLLVPDAPTPPPDINSTPLQARAALQFFVCAYPDFYAVMNVCDRAMYQWIAQIPGYIRPYYLNNAGQRIASAANQQQYQQWSSCETGRYASQSGPAPGLRIAVSSRLAGKASGAHASAGSGSRARLAVPFAPGTPPPPGGCPALPYHYLHQVAQLGINYYPQNTRIQFKPNPYAQQWNGIGPWEGAKVRIIWSLNGGPLVNIQDFFVREADISSPKVFDHWVSFATRNNPSPPPELLARSEPLSFSALEIETPVSYDPLALPGMRGQGWHVFTEYRNLDDGQTYVADTWIETTVGFTPLVMGGYSAAQTHYDYLLGQQDDYHDPDGVWVHRKVVQDFKRMPANVFVYYNNDRMETGVSSITPTATTYLPGISTGIACCEETVQVRTVGATKASFRILDVEPVPGFGVRLTLKVVNELHFAACIVTPSLTGIGDRTSWQDNVMHFYMPAIWVVRNLPANTESDPLSILVPMNIVAPGDWPLRDLHWRLYVAQEAYPAPLNQMTDGIYGAGSLYNAGYVSGPYPNIGDWPPPGYKISNSPEQYAFLLAGYLENGDKVWHSPWDGTVDPQRVLMTLPVYKAPGADVPYVRDPRFGDITYPTYSDQVPFLGFVDWSAEYKVSSNPEVWEARSGVHTIGLSLPAAIARYGRYLTLSVAAGRPLWSPYYQRWVVAFETWPGGNVDELESYLVDTYVRPQYRPEAGWRNFQYASRKRPYLTAGVMWWFATTPLNDRTGYIHALTLIKESSNPDSVDVVLMGYW
jgi:hypothetical protein